MGMDWGRLVGLGMVWDVVGCLGVGVGVGEGKGEGKGSVVTCFNVSLGNMCDMRGRSRGCWGCVVVERSLETY